MPDLKPVALTSYTVEKMSRHDLLGWVNTLVKGNYTKIEELCSGIAYCQMMELLFPNCIGSKKIKLDAKHDYDYLHNLKLFQHAFVRLKFDKEVPLERLVKGRFQDNFEFLQWFKKFYDTHKGIENITPNEATPSAPVAVGNVQQQQRKICSRKNSVEISDVNANSAIAESGQLLKETLEHLTQQAEVMKNERDFYYNKVVQIEKV